MNADSENVTRRRRKAPQRRVPVVVNQPDRRPFLFGWGGELTQREREALKERIALFAGIALAIIVVGLLGWGLLQDEVITPHNIAEQNAKPIAQVGNYTIRTGFFKRFQEFQNTEIANQIAQYQSEVQQLNANPTKNSAQIQQAEAQIAELQQQQKSVTPNSLDTLIDYEVLLQRASAAGVHYTRADVDKAMTNLMKQQGGKHSFDLFVQNSGLSLDEIRMLVTADMLRSKVTSKLAKTIPSTSTEVRARHILLSPKDKALAQRLLNEVEHGANFAALAKKYSKDPGSAAKGGDLGYFKKDAMVKPFANAAFATPVGQFTLVKSQFGWHVIQVTGRKTVKQSSTDKQQALQQAYQTWIAQQKAQLHVQRFVAPAALPTVVATPIPTNVIQQTIPQPVTTAVVSTHPVKGKGVPAVKPPTKPTGKKP